MDGDRRVRIACEEEQGRGGRDGLDQKILDTTTNNALESRTEEGMTSPSASALTRLTSRTARRAPERRVSPRTRRRWEEEGGGGARWAQEHEATIINGCARVFKGWGECSLPSRSRATLSKRQWSESVGLEGEGEQPSPFSGRGPEEDMNWRGALENWTRERYPYPPPELIHRRGEEAPQYCNCNKLGCITHCFLILFIYLYCISSPLSPERVICTHHTLLAQALARCRPRTSSVDCCLLFFASKLFTHDV